VAYGARLEIVLGVKTLAGSNPASSATDQHGHFKICRIDRPGSAASRCPRMIPSAPGCSACAGVPELDSGAVRRAADSPPVEFGNPSAGGTREGKRRPPHPCMRHLQILKRPCTYQHKRR
jgi:hypothetical protein